MKTTQSLPFENVETIFSYPWQQAVEDGFLVELFQNRWKQLTGGKPILATSAIYGEFSQAAFQEIWNEFVHWKQIKEPLLPIPDRLFTTSMNGQTVWVTEDEAVFTILFPSDY